MSESSDKPQDQYNDNLDDLSARLLIFVDKDGVMEYNCDWTPGTGMKDIASIFYKIMFDNLSDSILQEIKQQCVLNGNEEDYVNLINIISALALDNISNETNSVDDIVVPPDRVFSI